MAYQREIELASEYLHRKYGICFDIHSVSPIGIDQPFYLFYFTPSFDSQDMVRVVFDNERYRDNYYGVVIKEKYDELLLEAVKPYVCIEEMKSKFIASSFPDELMIDSSIEEALSKYPSCFISVIDFYVCDEASLSEISVGSICNDLYNKNIRGVIRFIRKHADAPDIFEVLFKKIIHGRNDYGVV